LEVRIEAWSDEPAASRNCEVDPEINTSG